MAWVKQKSHFVVFEGGEGSGKTTQARLLYERLKRAGHMVAYTDEPGATLKGFQIRTILLDRDNEPLDPVAEFLLFEADRAQHISLFIRPNLEKGYDIICDRFSPSTFAYQGHARGLAKQHLKDMKRIDALARQNIEPDLYILLDIDPAEALSRIKTQKTRFEEEQLAFHQKVREGFLQQAGATPKKWLKIAASQSIEIIRDTIWEHIQKLIAKKK
ncbi:MAG: dTMP kinase [Parcubacteria group bacterium Gr01-1014_66]|nr:MAG: dTMP kinase [Parcubacteria group bacterium Gr01-1014_66]